MNQQEQEETKTKTETTLSETPGKNEKGKTKRKKKKQKKEEEEMRRSILCVDDNNVNLLILRRYLSGAYRILTVSSGVEALSLLGKEEVDLVLMDIMMPEMDGYETTERIRKMSPTLPILYVSSKAEEPRGYECGGNGYIMKPVERKGILAKITEYIK